MWLRKVAVLSFVFSMTMLGAPVGFILACIDLINKDETKRHGLAIAGLVIGLLFTIGIIGAIFD